MENESTDYEISDQTKKLEFNLGFLQFLTHLILRVEIESETPPPTLVEITSLPPSLKLLSVSGNNLSLAQSSLEGLTNLKTLKLNHNSAGVEKESLADSVENLFLPSFAPLLLACY